MRSGPDERDVRTQLFELAEEISIYLESIVPSLSVLRSAGMHVESITDRREDLPPVRARREVVGWFSRAIARGLLRPVQPSTRPTSSSARYSSDRFTSTSPTRDSIRRTTVCIASSSWT